jgi:CDP-diacylglycerol--glycerol-3-phosphate 3-phosphatidyltransferase
MSWTSAFGRACGVLLQAIVNGLALTRISPNVLTFIGLIINTGAAILFGYANAHNYVRMFLLGGLVIIGAGIFDMVDGRVARKTDKVTVFGAFFDSVIDRYSDVVLFFGLLVFYARGNRFFYVVFVAFVIHFADGQLYPRPRRSPHRQMQGRLHGAPRTHRAHHVGALFNRWGAMAPVLWVLAVLSTITVIHRISYTYQMTKHLAPIREPKPLPLREQPIAASADLQSATTAPRG